MNSASTKNRSGRSRSLTTARIRASIISTPARCDYLFGLVRPTGDVQLGQDSDCDFPRPPSPVVIIGPPARQVTAGGSWRGRLTDGVLTLVHSGFLSVMAPGGDETCQASDHRWDLRRK